MTAIDAVLGAIRAAASAQDRPVARPHRAAARRSRLAADAPAAGRPRRRAPTARARPSPSCAPIARGGGQARPRLHLAASGALQRAHPARRRAGRRRAARRRARRAASAVNAGQSISVFEITTAAAFLLFSETPADYLLLEVGPRRPLRRDQRDRAAGGDGDHAGVDRPSRISRRDGREDRLREGGHPASRGAPAIVAEQDERGARASSSARRCRSARRGASPGATSSSAPRTAGSSSRTPTGCSTCRRRGSPAAISSATPRRRSRRCGRSSRSLPNRAFERGLHRSRMAGAAATAARRAAGRAARRRRPRSGSTAPTTKRAGARSPKRWPISKITRRGRWR